MQIKKHIRRIYDWILQFIKENFVWLVLLAAVAFSTWLMCYTFGYDNGRLFIKGKLLSDFQSHIALIRSFSQGQNFPPEFPHFAGLPIRYHFLFYWFVGLLERAGVRLDVALNSLSIMGMVGLLMMVYFLGTKIGKSKWIGLGASIMVVLNSSFSWLYYFFIGDRTVSSWQALFKISEFPAFGPYNDTLVSAFWNLNIYTNQRHLAFSFALMFFAIWLVIYRKGWKSFVTAIIIIGTLSWLHKVAWLITFVVLGVMFLAHFNIRKRVYFAALFGLALSLPGIFYLNQSVAAGSALVSVQYGFLAYATSWKEFNVVSPQLRFIIYWLLNLGILPVLAIAGFIGVIFDHKPNLEKRNLWYFLAKIINPENAWFYAALLVFIIANVFTFGPDIATNHKLINFTAIVLGIYALMAIRDLYKVLKFPVLMLFPVLIFGGICDLIPIVNDHTYDLFSPQNIESANWVRANTSPDAVFLSFNGDIAPILSAGRKEYLGAPYIAWSMGYPYDARSKEVISFVNKGFPNTSFCYYLGKHKLTNISYDPNDKTLFYDNGGKVLALPKSWGPGTKLKDGIIVYSTDNICLPAK